MKEFKIRVNSPEEAKNLQELLFSLGIFWCNGSHYVSCTSSPFFYVQYNEDDEMRLSLTHSASYDKDYFDGCKLPQMELVQKISYEFKEIPKKRTVVKVGEFSYYEDELSEALKNIKPI